MSQIKLDQECEIVLLVKMPDGTIAEQHLWTAAKGEVLSLKPRA